MAEWKDNKRVVGRFEIMVTKNVYDAWTWQITYGGRMFITALHVSGFKPTRKLAREAAEEALAQIRDTLNRELPIDVRPLAQGIFELFGLSELKCVPKYEQDQPEADLLNEMMPNVIVNKLAQTIQAYLSGGK